METSLGAIFQQLIVLKAGLLYSSSSFTDTFKNTRKAHKHINNKISDTMGKVGKVSSTVRGFAISQRYGET